MMKFYGGGARQGARRWCDEVGWGGGGGEQLREHGPGAQLDSCTAMCG
eukprot:COSAG01_NODE_834_length_13230_cov_18.826746_12_plen_48_part_00